MVMHDSGISVSNAGYAAVSSAAVLNGMRSILRGAFISPLIVRLE